MDGFDKLRSWLDQGFAGEMEYITGTLTRAGLRPILPNVRSVVMVGTNYKPGNRVQGPGVGGQGGKACKLLLAAANAIHFLEHSIRIEGLAK